jgi:hypothetical protein
MSVMNEAERHLVVRAGQQHQVFSRAQAHLAGLSPSAVSRRVASGSFVEVGRRSLTFAGVSLTWRGQLQAGIMDLGPGALVSAEAAAALHGLDGFGEGALVYLVPRSMRRRTTNGVVTSSAVIGPLDRWVIDGLPVVSPTRAVVELIGRVGQLELGNALDSAIRRRLTAPSVIQRCVGEVGRAGRPGVGMFDDLMEFAGVESWLERRFLGLLRGTGLPRPAIQRIYRSDHVHVARVDFDFDPLPLIVEVGGRRGYMSGAERRRQEHRRNSLQLLGKVVYFFTTEDVTDDPGYVLATLRHCVRQRVS